jgi:hypothetical protein
VWTTATGLGIRFTGIPRAQKRDINRMLQERFSLRQKVDRSCTCAFEQNEREATMLNLSSGGCYIRSSVDGLSEEAHGMISLPMNDALHHPP